MLHAACSVGDGVETATMPTIFASRYGDARTTLALFEALSRGEALGAGAFSHSVHNAQAALFSMLRGNQGMSTALAAGEETFPCAFLEALSTLWGTEHRRVLLVVGDEPLPPVWGRTGAGDPHGPYAVAFIIARPETGGGVALDTPPGEGESVPTVACPWPQAVEFLRWFLAEERSLTLGGGGRPWRWTRLAEWTEAPS